MGDPTTDFFESLGARGREPLLRRVSGTLRFDLADGAEVSSWHVAISDGDLTVSREKQAADCVVVCDRELFDRLASGTANAMAATLRGLLDADGDLSLVILFQRLFPGPPPGNDQREPAGYARRTS